MDQPTHVTYWAISVANSKTMIGNFLLLLGSLGTFIALMLPVILQFMQLPEVAAMIPTKYAVLFAALIAMGNLWARTTTERPVAFIKPGTTMPVQVEKIGPPPPPLATD